MVAGEEQARVLGEVTGLVGACTLERTLPGHLFADFAVALTPDGARIVASGGDGTIRIWSFAGGELEREFDAGDDLHPTVLGSGLVRSLTVTPDGRRIVSGTSHGKVRIWDLATGDLEREIEAHDRDVTCVAVTPDGSRIVSAGYDCAVCVWDLATGDLERLLADTEPNPISPWQTPGVWAVAVTPDGRHVVSGAAQSDDALRVWDVTTGRLERTLEGHQGQAFALAITPNGNTIVSGGEDCTVRVWDLAGGRLERTLEGHAEQMRSVAVTPDGRRIVSGDYDGVVLIWDLASGQLECRLEAHDSGAYGIAVTRDGRRLVTGGGDGQIRVWSLVPAAAEGAT